MLFFQLLLLAGYVYSHAYVRLRIPARRHIHIALLALAAATLPLAASTAWKPEGGEDPTWRILGLLATSVGLPYFALSTTVPWCRPGTRARMKQPRPTASSRSPTWARCSRSSPIPLPSTAARIGHTGGRLVGRLCPVRGCVRDARLAEQRCRGAAPRGRRVGQARRRPAGALGGTRLLRIGAAARLYRLYDAQHWRRFPFSGCCLCPLSVELRALLRSSAGYRRWLFVPLLAAGLACVCVTLTVQSEHLDLIPLYSATLFTACMVCHGELARSKPHPQHLTGSISCLRSAGRRAGVLVGLVAPNVFEDLYELRSACSRCARS